MNEDILKLIETLYKEFNNWKTKLEEAKALEFENSFDTKLKANIIKTQIESRLKELGIA
jgi:hypothetical protein